MGRERRCVEGKQEEGKLESSCQASVTILHVPDLAWPASSKPVQHSHLP